MLTLALGLLCAFMGLLFLGGCFTRVDSPAFIARASGDDAKIAKLHALQDAWDKLGRLRQFLASSSCFLIMASGLLALWHDPQFAKLAWIVLLFLAANLLGLLQVRRRAVRVLDSQSAGHSEVFRVIQQNIRMSITFGVIFGFLAYRA